MAAKDKEQEQGADDGSDGKDKQKKKDINEMEEPEVDDDHVSTYKKFSYLKMSKYRFVNIFSRIIKVKGLYH